MEHHSFLINILFYLVAAIIMVPLAKRLGMGAVLGYLVAGVVIGPWGLGLIKNVEVILSFSEFGVVLLLFLIGLELEPKRLWLLRRPIFGWGGAQVGVVSAGLCAVAMAFGVDWRTALVGALGLSLSSTAIVLATLGERKLMSTPAGSAGFSILLFQDIAAIPMIALVPLLGGLVTHSGEPGWLRVAKLAAVLAALVIGGRFLVNPILRFIAKTDLREIFTAFALLLVIAICVLMESVGRSMALGTFMAGGLLADSEYRHELISDLEPFKGLLLGLFFIAVGMDIDLDAVVAQPELITAGVATLLTVKFALLFGIGRWPGRLDPRGALMLAGTLWLGGEFAFVVFSEAARVKLMDAQLRNQLTAIVGVSMALTPVLLLGLHRLLAEVKRPPPQGRTFDEIPDAQPQVLIAGMGRFGQIVARLLTAQRIPFVALEHSTETVDTLRRFGNIRLYYGDPTRPDLLRSAGAQHVKVFVIAMDDPDTNIKATRLIRRMFPEARVLARARNRQHAWRLMDLSAEAYRETLGSSLEMAQQVLVELGVPPETAAEHTRRFRAHDEKLLRAQYLVYDDDGAVIQTARDAISDLERLFEADASGDGTPPGAR